MRTRSSSRGRARKTSSSASPKPSRNRSKSSTSGRTSSNDNAPVGFLNSVLNAFVEFIIYLQSGRDPELKCSDDDTQPVLFDSGLPFGESLFWSIMDRDPAPTFLKWTYLIVTSILLVCVTVLDEVLVRKMGVSQAAHEAALLPTSARVLSLSEEQIADNLRYACAFFVVLALLHLWGLCWPRRWYDPKTNKYATSCYDEMFAEPLSCAEGPRGERPVLIARWGNTISNMFYLATALCVTQSVLKEQSPYHLADQLFAVNLLLLSLFSTLWHAANYNKEHYLDLWAMDHAILYLVFRHIAMCASWYMGPSHQNLISWLLFLYYAISLVAALVSYSKEARSANGTGMFDKGFPPSGRRRLTKVDANNVPHMLMSGFCVFLGLPVIYMLIPATTTVLLGNVGSASALHALTLSLTVGWTYRMSERFCVDGHTLLSIVSENLRVQRKNGSGGSVKAVALTAVAAVLSPTAILHWMTGISLYAGFVHARSLDLLKA